MANWNDPQPTGRGFGASPSLSGTSTRGEVFDVGLRRHMLSIYNYMASGVMLSGIVALMAVTSGMTQAVAGTPLMWLVMLAPLAFVLFMSFGANKFSTTALQGMFWGFAVAMGLSMSTIFLVYTGASIATTFFATAGAFAGLSLYGYTTKKDLSGMGSFLIMGMVGLFVAMLLNLFFKSGTMALVISALGVLIFAGLTAYDTQSIKNTYIAHAQSGDQDWLAKSAIMGALNLYLDFLNMFMFLLQFMGNRD